MSFLLICIVHLSFLYLLDIKWTLSGASGDRKLVVVFFRVNCQLLMNFFIRTEREIEAKRGWWWIWNGMCVQRLCFCWSFMVSLCQFSSLSLSSTVNFMLNSICLIGQTCQKRFPNSKKICNSSLFLSAWLSFSLLPTRLLYKRFFSTILFAFFFI